MAYIADRMVLNRLFSFPMLRRAILGAVILTALTSCFATADKLAVYVETALSKNQVDALTGYYGWVGEKGNISSVSFAPRTDTWSYLPPERVTRPLELASAEFALKSLTIFEDGDTAVFIVMGVAVFSGIPGTDLILVSIPGETLRLNDKSGNMSPASEQNAKTNLFFILEHDGSELRKQFYSDDDEFLQTAVGDPSKPLPVDKLLDYLEKHAEERFLAEELTAYELATPQRERLIEQEMNAALSEDKEKAVRGAARDRSHLLSLIFRQTIYR